MSEASYLQKLPNENEATSGLPLVSQGITKSSKASNRTQPFNWLWLCWTFEPYPIDRDHTQVAGQQQVGFHCKF